MNVSKYLFQSPYNSLVQVGRPDPSSSKDTEVQAQLSTSSSNVSSKSQPEFTQAEATQEVSSENSVELTQLLDVYA